MHRLRWWLRSRRCGCGQERIAKGTALERSGVRHRTDGPCFRCDEYGNPL